MAPAVPSPEEIAWMLARPHDSLIPDIIACAAVTLAAATVFVGLRLWSRRIVNGRLHLDVSDWFAVAAWVFYVVYTALIILLTHYGLGRHIVFVTNARLLGIFIVVAESLYAVIIALLKLGILAMYRKLFGTSRTFTICTWAVSALVIEYLLQVVLATNLQCVPIAASWDPSVHGTCINYGTEALVAYLINITTDLLILGLPIPTILRLNAPKSQKRRLTISLAAGGSAFIISLVQLAYITRLGTGADVSWSIVPSSLLGDVEIMVGFLATSIATYRPLYRFIFKESVGNRPGGLADDGLVNYNGACRNNSHGRRVSVVTGDTPHILLGASRRGITVTDYIELRSHDNPVAV
ncbi:hypothetical protein F4802DRAFT_367946 [Xylaria palmicola]|nr:hypothetical protein F4802DRAFT_367946 [Xylaria palmicola]